MSGRPPRPAPRRVRGASAGVADSANHVDGKRPTRRARWTVWPATIPTLTWPTPGDVLEDAVELVAARSPRLTLDEVCDRLGVDVDRVRERAAQLRGGEDPDA